MASLSAAMERMQPYLDRMAVWRGYEDALTSLTIVTIGIAVYTILVYAFYQNLSQRRAYHTGWGKGHWWGKVVSGAEGILVFPVMSFLYFAVLSGGLFLLAKSQSTYQILLLAMATVASVRLISYVTEIGSADLAKLLPLSLLAVLLVDPSYATWGAVWARYQEIPSLLPVIGRFFLLFLAFETTLRLAAWAIASIKAALGRRPVDHEVVPEALDSIHDGDFVSLTPTEGASREPSPPKQR